MRRIEFWPDYGGVLLHDEGPRLPLDGFNVPDALRSAVDEWLDRYDDAKLDPATRDAAWIAEGQQLFDRLHEALEEAEIELVDWEGYWNRSGDAGGT